MHVSLTQMIIRLFSGLSNVTRVDSAEVLAHAEHRSDERERLHSLFLSPVWLTAQLITGRNPIFFSSSMNQTKCFICTSTATTHHTLYTLMSKIDWHVCSPLQKVKSLSINYSRPLMNFIWSQFHIQLCQEADHVWAPIGWHHLA